MQHESLGLDSEPATDGAEAERLADVPAHKWPRTLVDLIDIHAEAYRPHVASDAQAERLARIGVAAMAKYAGGATLYLPTGKALERELVHDAIYRESRRGNSRELGKKYGYCDRQVQRIIAAQHARRRVVTATHHPPGDVTGGDAGSQTDL